MENEKELCNLIGEHYLKMANSGYYYINGFDFTAIENLDDYFIEWSNNNMSLTEFYNSIRIAVFSNIDLNVDTVLITGYITYNNDFESYSNFFKNFNSFVGYNFKDHLYEIYCNKKLIKVSDCPPDITEIYTYIKLFLKILDCFLSLSFNRKYIYKDWNILQLFRKKDTL